jgi:diguanylate cyclase (GGDEF)-like protein
MSSDFETGRVENLLREAGVRIASDRALDGRVGFAYKTETGAIFEPNTPPILDQFNPSEVGIVILDHNLKPIQSWGIARNHSLFQLGVPVSSEIRNFINLAPLGEATRLVHQDLELFAPLTSASETILLVTDASAYQESLHNTQIQARTADSLKSLGRALSLCQSMETMCAAAAHELSSSNDLAAVMIWSNDPTSSKMKLVGHIGVTRNGLSLLGQLNSSETPGSLAELAAYTQRSVSVQIPANNVFANALETKVTYLKPGPVRVYPLIINNRLLGVLEVIAQENDTLFAYLDDLFQTVSEHLSFAMQTSILFDEFERLAFHDALTGLANHRHLHETLSQRVNEAERNETSIGVIMIDVDHFRSFNEEEGHDAGDDVLRLVAASLKECLRPYDLAARYGGEEFSVIMPGSNAKAAMAVAERMRESIANMPYVTKNGVRRKVTASFGVAVFPDNANDAASVLKAADVALYEAKRNGRNKALLFNGEMQGKDRQLAIELETALQWLSPVERAEAALKIERLSHYIDAVTEVYRLTVPQLRILETLIQIVPEYLVRLHEHDLEPATLAGVDGFRILLPNLLTIEENFDGTGPKALTGNDIPILSRLTQGLLAADEGILPNSDDGRFDPSIRACIAGIQRAA